MTVRNASCPTCGTAVLARGSRCPWCQGDLTPNELLVHSVQRALEVMLVVQLVLDKEAVS
jgi:tRNA(Ile2) C34 agmatinyltransferase TiaS